MISRVGGLFQTSSTARPAPSSARAASNVPVFQGRLQAGPTRDVFFGSTIMHPGELYLHTGARVPKRLTYVVREAIKHMFEDPKSQGAVASLYRKAQNRDFPIPPEHLEILASYGLTKPSEGAAPLIDRIVLASINARKDSEDHSMIFQWVPDFEFFLPPHKTFQSEIVTLRNGASIALSELVRIRSNLRILLEGAEPGSRAYNAVFDLYQKAQDPFYPILREERKILAEVDLYSGHGKINENVVNVLLSSLHVSDDGALELLDEATRIRNTDRKSNIRNVGADSDQALAIADAVGVHGDKGFEVLTLLQMHNIVGPALVSFYERVARKDLMQLASLVLQKSALLTVFAENFHKKSPPRFENL